MGVRKPLQQYLSFSSEELLDSWKEIASHLSRDVRTVQRWERTRALPVHRLPGGAKPGVFALKPEVDRWWQGEQQRPGDLPETATPPVREPSVAVLPFANLSADRENEYFSDGLADEIITALSRMPGLHVTARTSSFAFRGKERDVREIGAALGVSTILEGSVQRSRDRIRVSAQLVSARNGFHLWSEHYDSHLGDLFEIQDRISRAIAGAFAVHAGPSSAVRPAPLPEAYHQWLKGRYYHRYESAEVIGHCMACYRQAIALDPSFSRPYLGLAESYRGLSDYGNVRPKEVGPDGWAAIRTARGLDDSIGEAYALSGAYRGWLEFDWQGAEEDFAKAVILSPAAVEAHSLRAMTCLVPCSRLHEAVLELRKALELDPLSLLMHSWLGWVLGFSREFPAALRELEAALALNPEYPVALGLRGSILYYAGRVEEGVASWRAAVERMGRAAGALGALGYGIARLGRRAEAAAILGELDAAAERGYVTPISRAWVHLGLGDADAAFHWLNQAVDERDPHLLHLPSKPVYDPIRDDPRFHALLSRMRLT
ncbi:MAG: hypothetical protein IPM24_27565 [Bryobacterales bacterium]|nr:hypothetical protein [Bryobacterales bacterium]